MRTRTLIASAAVAVAGWTFESHADQPVYKSVDEAGNVTYSDAAEVSFDTHSDVNTGVPRATETGLLPRDGSQLLNG